MVALFNFLMEHLLEVLKIIDGAVNAAGIAYRQSLEDRLDTLAAEPWRRLGPDLSQRFIQLLEPATESLLARVDVTAGPKWMPAGRRHTTGDAT